MSPPRVLTSRADALPALAEAFREHGLAGTSVATLTKATGLGKGSLYNFFPGGKVEMMDAVLADIDRWFVAAIFAPLERAGEQAGNPAPAIRAMMADVTAYFRSGGRTCLVGSVGLGVSGDVFAGRTKGYFLRWIAALAHCLHVGGVPVPLAMELAEAAVSGIQGAIVLARALGEEAAFVRIVRRQERALLDALADNGG